MTLDEYTGDVLPPELVMASKEEEVVAMESVWKVWGVVPVAEAWRVTGRKPLGGRWVCCNKGGRQSPDIRARWCAKEVTTYDIDDIKNLRLKQLTEKVADLCDLQPTPASMVRPPRKEMLKELRGELAQALVDAEAELEAMGGSVSAASMISAKTAKSKAASVKSAATAKSAASTAKSAAAAPAAAAPPPTPRSFLSADDVSADACAE